MSGNARGDHQHLDAAIPALAPRQRRHLRHRRIEDIKLLAGRKPHFSKLLRQTAGFASSSLAPLCLTKP